MKRASSLLCGAIAPAGCRSCQQPAATPTADAALPAGDAGPDAIAEIDTMAPKFDVGDARKILFSRKGTLAFIHADIEHPAAFRVIDLRTGKTRDYDGEPQRTSALGFDNRCDVSSRGYMPNVDVWFIETDGAEESFVRHDWKGNAIRENIATGAGTPIVEPPPPAENDEVVLLDTKNGLRVVDHTDMTAATPKVRRCLFDPNVPADKGLCIDYQPADTFRHALESDDGKIFVWNGAVWGKTTKDPDDEYARDTSADQCFLYIANRNLGKITKLKSPCTVTGELPIKLEGDVLTTDNSPIYRCSKNTVIRRYNVKTGSFVDEKRGPPTPDDIDAKLAAAIKASPNQSLPYFMKQNLWAETYGFDALVSWSEGDSVLARKEGKLFLCKKRGATCGPALIPFGEDGVGGSSPDGLTFGAIANGHFYAIDSTSGAVVRDLALLPP